jgi:hypothetical protein
MSDKRNLGVTEARLGLSLLSCLLVALGYVVLQRLGDTAESSPEDIAPDQSNVSFHPAEFSPSGGNVQPQILPVQGSEPSPAPYPHTSQRPLWLAPQQGTDDTSLQRFDPAATVGDAGQPSLFDPQPIEPRQTPDESTRY